MRGRLGGLLWFIRGRGVGKEGEKVREVGRERGVVIREAINIASICIEETIGESSEENGSGEEED